uniref:CBM21 domain-containing protein n=1 Tax=Bionectria ochroleuca TaxID=29856 RepID=A0A8H7K3X7_BIOOC
MKSVLCRFTLDRWATFSDVCANYSPRVEYAGETEGYDRFEFSINLLGPIGLGVERIILCVCFACNNQLYWDNNNGANYNILLAKQTSIGEEGPLVLDCRPLESISANHAQNIDRTMIDDVPLKINKPQTSVAKIPISFKQQLRAKQLPISIRSRADHWPSVSENHFLYSGWNEISCGE